MMPGMMAGLMPQANPVVAAGTGGKAGTGGTATARSSGKAGIGTVTADNGRQETGPTTTQSKAGNGQGVTNVGSRTPGANAGSAAGINAAPDGDATAGVGADAGGNAAGGPSGSDPDGNAAVLKSFTASLAEAAPAAAAGQAVAAATAAAAARTAADLAPPAGAAQGIQAAGGVGGDGGNPGRGDAALTGDGGSSQARSGTTTPDGSLSTLTGLNGTQATNGQDFASQLTAVRSSRPGLPTSATDQVTVQLQRSVKDGDGSISMQLRPEELGRIDIKLDIDKDGSVNATITADRPQTLELLQRDSHTLERALQDAGLQTNNSSLNFGLRGDGGQGYSQQQQQQGDTSGNGTGRNGGQRNGAGGIAATDDDVSAGTLMVLRRYQAPPGRVDVRI